MTIKEALQAIVNYAFISPFAFDKAIVDAGLVASDEYTQQDQKAVDLCAAGLLLTVLISPKVSEGGFSISPGDIQSIKETRSLILKKYSLDDELKPSIKAPKLW